MSEPQEMINRTMAEGPSVIDTEAVLDDDALRAGGLVPVRTWARTKASNGALRSRRARQRAEAGETGPPRRQVSVLAPPDDEARDALRAIAAAMVAGDVTADQLRELRPAQFSMPADDEAHEIGRRALDLIGRGGWRSRALKLLLRTKKE